MFRTSITAALIAGIALNMTTLPVFASEAGGTVRDHRNTTNVRDHRTNPNVRDHRSTPTGRSEIPQQVFDCGFGILQLLEIGFKDVKAESCNGSVYRYSAKYDLVILPNAEFAATMNATNGELDVTFVGSQS